MHKIEYRQGDLLTTDIAHIVHGCNSLANGDWNVISAIIENTLTKTKPVVYQL